MEFRAFRSEDHELLDDMAERFYPGMAFEDEDGRRIGSIIRAWRAGDYLMVEVECIPEHFAGRRKTVWVTTDRGLKVVCKVDRG